MDNMLFYSEEKGEFFKTIMEEKFSWTPETTIAFTTV